MKKINVSFVGMILAVFLSVDQTYSQQAAESAPSRYAFIDSRVFFDENNGIPEVIKASKIIEESLKSQLKELLEAESKQRLRVEKFKKDFDTLGTIADFDPRLVRERQQELQLEADKYQLLRYSYEKTWDKVKDKHFSPIRDKIRSILSQFAKENGYDLILDLANVGLGGEGYSISIIDKPDITKDFLKYYKNFVSSAPISN